MHQLTHFDLSDPDRIDPARPHAFPWVRWAMKGSHFKLLHADPASGRFTLLIRIAPNVEAPRHRHIGAVEGYILEGSFYYRDEPQRRYTAGSYLHEEAGSVHHPVSPEGALMLAVFHGPIEGLNDEDNVTGRVDCAWHVDVWRAACEAGAAAAK